MYALPGSLFFLHLLNHISAIRFRCLILLVLFCLLFAQSPLQAQDDSYVEQTTIEVDNLLRLARLADGDSERSALSQRALLLARDVHYDGGVVRASLLLGQMAMQQGRNEEALQYYLEAESKVPATGNQGTLVAINTALGDLFFRERLYETARRYYRAVLGIQPQDYAIMEKMADASLYDLRYDSAEVYYKALIVRYREVGDNPQLIQIYQKLASAYDQKGDAGKSLYYYLPIEALIERYGTTQEKSLLYNNLGRQYVSLGDYVKALKYFRDAELLCIYIPCDYPEVLYANMGIAMHNTGDTKGGIDKLLKARGILVNRQDVTALANLEHLIAGVYFSNNDIYNALIHNDLSIKYAHETKQATVLANAYRTEADLYHSLYDFEKAFDYYRQYLNVLDSARVEEQIRQQRLDQQRSLLSNAEGQIKYLIARQNFKTLELQQVRYEQERLKLTNEKLELEIQQSEDKALLLQKQKEVDQVQLRARALQVLQARQEARLAAQQLDAEKQDRLIVNLRQQETIDRAQRYADSTQRAQEVEILDLKIRQQGTFQRFAYGVGGLMLVILLLVGGGFLYVQRANNRLNAQNHQIQAQNKEIEAERNKSDRLLLNILPEEIAQELKSKGYAKPRLYESATVLFTDFVNFTRLSATLLPEALIDELNECFHAFDLICDKFGLEKIKTIGDAFMCVGGLPVPNATHVQDAVRAALEMNHWIQTRNRDNPKAVFREMRIGVHTGPVVAGVIGKNKFAFDIWGDAVNLAARLEELGEPGRVNISSTTAEALGDQFRLTYRGEKEVHNKGLVAMYFVEEGSTGQ